MPIESQDIKPIYSNGELENVLQEYRDFAYSVSHDLQSTIWQLKSLTDLLVEDIDRDYSPKQQKYKEMIDDVAANAEQMINALLIFSRLSADDLCLDNVNLNNIISDALDKIKSEYIDIPFDLIVDEMPIIYGDYNLLSDVFYYLIDNALKFQPKNQKPIVRIGVDNKDGKNIFRISDNGIGMEPSQINTSFIMLKKLNANEDYKGAGAGLSLAKKIIGIHKGRIWVNSKPEKGTKVYFTLGDCI